MESSAINLWIQGPNIKGNLTRGQLKQLVVSHSTAAVSSTLQLITTSEPPANYYKTTAGTQGAMDEECALAYNLIYSHPRAKGEGGKALDCILQLITANQLPATAREVGGSANIRG